MFMLYFRSVQSDSRHEKVKPAARHVLILIKYLLNLNQILSVLKNPLHALERMNQSILP